MSSIGDPSTRPATQSAPGSSPPPGSASAHPFSIRGLAGFATASLNRLCCFQIAAAVFSSLVVSWCVATGIFPVVDSFIRQLPEAGELRNGQWVVSATDSAPEASNHWIAIRFDPEGRDLLPGSAAQPVQVVLQRRYVQLCTLLNCVSLAYPAHWRLPLNRIEVVPWWGAWRTMILVGVVFVALCLLLVTWWALATLYCWIPLVMAGMGDRVLSLTGAWRLAAASLLPAAALAAVAMAGLAGGWLDLSAGLALFALHVVAPFPAMSFAVTRLPRRLRACPAPAAAISLEPEAPGAAHDGQEPSKPGIPAAAPEPNPFVNPGRAEASPAASTKPRRGNPFAKQ